MGRVVWGLLLVAVLGAIPRQCFTADKINFAYSALSGLQAPLWVAKEAGFFKKHDIDPQVLLIVGGRVISQTMFAGEVQMGVASMAALLQANTAGGDLVYVAYFGSKTDYALFATKDITDIKQVRGKRLGIGQFGGGPDFTSCSKRTGWCRTKTCASFRCSYRTRAGSPHFRRERLKRFCSKRLPA